MGAAASVLQRSVDGAVESFLDEDERFVHLVMISFDDDADAQQQLPAGRVLKALVGVYELVAATLPPAGRRLIMRPPEQADLDAELGVMGLGDTPLDFDRYDALARAVFRRIVVDRGRRLMVGVFGGCVCLAFFKATLRRTPLVGPLFHSIILPLLPAGAGPVLGVAAVAYVLPDRGVPALPWKAPRRTGARSKSRTKTPHD